MSQLVEAITRSWNASSRLFETIQLWLCHHSTQCIATNTAYVGYIVTAIKSGCLLILFLFFCYVMEYFYERRSLRLRRCLSRISGRFKMSFIEKYEKAEKKGVRGIPNWEMSRPYPPPNALGDVGLELEVEPARGINLPAQGVLGAVIGPKTKAQWLVHQDGSLRNGGLEYVLSQPCLEEELEGLFTELYKVFERAGTVLNLSNSCSTHVHVNVGGYKVNELTAVIILWTMFEEMLVNFCGEQRKTNHFCLTAKESPATLQAWENFLNTGIIRFPDGIKYSALNIRPITTQGSFEYRCMRAEKSPELLSLWSKFCLALTRYARKYKNPSLIANELSERSGIDIFMEICEGADILPFADLVMKTEGNENFYKMSVEGFRRCQQLSLGFPWPAWEEMIGQAHIPDPFNRKAKTTTETRADPDFEIPALEDEGRPRGVRIRPAPRPEDVGLPPEDFQFNAAMNAFQGFEPVPPNLDRVIRERQEQLERALRVAREGPGNPPPARPAGPFDENPDW